MFEVLPQLPADPILGLSAAFKADTNPHKIDLGVGVYKDEQGHTPILDSVAKAQTILLGKENSKSYITQYLFLITNNIYAFYLNYFIFHLLMYL